tara:strand:- start:473 stop:760 length:288 start_codon:yes stop_codon:yes gene_type:complete
MTYYAPPTYSLDIMQNNSSGTSEVNITLGLTGPTITLVNATDILGVYNSSGKKNPIMPYCEVDNKVPTLTDSWIAISASADNELTLNLKTNLSQI